MKKTKFKSLTSVVVLFFLVFGLTIQARQARAATAIDLGTAENFTILAGSAITDATPTGTVTGDVGLSPAAGTNITGLTSSQVSGTIYAVDATGPDGIGGNNPGLLTTAKSDLNTAYVAAAGETSDFTVLASSIDSFASTGYTLIPGVYTSASTMGITGTITLDGQGNPNSVFIFQTGSSLTTATNSQIVLTNGAQYCNIFWQVGSSATLGTNTAFAGTILAAASITDGGGSIVRGALLADADNDGTGAVTLSNTSSWLHPCAPSLTLIKTVTNDDGGAALANAWTLTATGTGGAPTNLSGTTPVASDETFKADTYTLSENGGPSGYTASAYRCIKNGGGAVVSNSITLADGDSAVCTINNNDDVIAHVVRRGSRGGGVVGGSRISNPNPIAQNVVNETQLLPQVLPASIENTVGLPQTGSPSLLYNENILVLILMLGTEVCLLFYLNRRKKEDSI